LYAASSREMAVDPSAMHDGLMTTVGASWSNNATGLRDLSSVVDVDSEMLTSPPPPPNVWTCTVPLFGRIQVISLNTT